MDMPETIKVSFMDLVTLRTFVSLFSTHRRPNCSQAIIEASNLPISIIIVGVGTENFRSMDILDADREPLRSNAGSVAQRDIVQFVPFNEKFSRELAPHVARARLAKEDLAEIPWQVVSYMRSRNLEPKSPIADLHDLPPDPEML
jgi:hypothetical protein